MFYLSDKYTKIYTFWKTDKYKYLVTDLFVFTDMFLYTDKYTKIYISWKTDKYKYLETDL